MNPYKMVNPPVKFDVDYLTGLIILAKYFWFVLF